MEHTTWDDGVATTAGDRRARRGRPSPRAARAAAAAGVTALALGSIVALAPPSSAAKRVAHPAAFLQVLAVPTYGKVLGNAKHFSLYALSSEKGTKATCTGKCLSIWPPVLVSTKVKAVSLGAGVTGHVGFVKRSATTKQVTLNGYPLFLFAKDTGPHQSHGEGIVAFGGTWTLVRPTAKTAAATLIYPPKKSTKTTTTSSGSGSGSGY